MLKKGYTYFSAVLHMLLAKMALPLQRCNSRALRTSHFHRPT